jgi:hypothetical protein
LRECVLVDSGCVATCTPVNGGGGSPRVPHSRRREFAEALRPALQPRLVTCDVSRPTITLARHLRKAYRMKGAQQPSPTSTTTVQRTTTAARVRRFGPPSVIAMEQIGVAEPGEGEVLIRVHALERRAA